MVLSLKTWKSRSLPGLPRTLNLFALEFLASRRGYARGGFSVSAHAGGRAIYPLPCPARSRPMYPVWVCRRSGGSPRAAFYATHGATIKQAPQTGAEEGRREKSMTAEAAAFAAPAAKAERAARLRVVAGWLWSGALLVLLGFLVLYPVAMLLLGALTNTNPVVDGFGVFDLSLANFITVLG